MLLDAKKIKEDKGKKKTERIQKDSQKKSCNGKKPIRQRQKQDTSVQNVKKRISLNNTYNSEDNTIPHVHIVEIVTTVLKMKS